MLNDRSVYSKRIGISADDLLFIKKIKEEKFGRKSLAGVLREIIKDYKSNNK